ncbi:hypothetical protein AYI68_g1057 [Smittium mucronatum]|uniref:Myb-like domain-containing protein n=1 Tax=Smittium mucronatum TaxID=133383 RepID=A0A1R0H6D1_9FUNG|nr:hypothetical protein AYI68_g1057 [Smittium mucronatum]
MVPEIASDNLRESNGFWDQKKVWVNNVRLRFCKRKDMPETLIIVDELGNLNQEYFKRPHGMEVEEERKWGDAEKLLLVQGIEKYGIGHFREVSDNLLPEWSANDLRVKTIRIIGRQNLQLYKDWKGNSEDIKHEYERNKKIGTELDCWKGGVLVYDDDGKVLKAILDSNDADPPFK